MEHLDFVLPGGQCRRPDGAWALAGVVASGNLEVLVEPAADSSCHVTIDTNVAGYAEIWHDVVEQGLARHGIGAVRISINDGGATPAVVSLRLDQAILDFLEERP